MSIFFKWSGAVLALACLILFYFLIPILTPFMLAAILAYLGNPFVERMEKLKLSRTLAVVIFFILLLLILVLLIMLFVPMLEHQVSVLAQQIPIVFKWVQSSLLPWLHKTIGVSAEFKIENIQTLASKHLKEIGGVVNFAWLTLTRSGAVLIKFLIDILLVFVVLFYLLRDWKDVIKRFEALLPRSIAPVVTRLVNECDDVLGAFLRGQLVVMFCLGIIYSLGLWLTGLQLALLIGMIAGLISIVPYLGSIIGIAMAIIASLVQFHNAGHLWQVFLVFIIGQSLEGMVLTPLLVGDRIGLHPIAVIFAILAGGQLFGFFGVLLALPIAAIIMVLLRHFHEVYLTSTLYKKQMVGE